MTFQTLTFTWIRLQPSWKVISEISKSAARIDKVLTKTLPSIIMRRIILLSFPGQKEVFQESYDPAYFFIYYFKNVLPINDIKTLMSGITEKNFAAGSKPELVEIYREVIRYQPEIMEQVRANLDVVENLAEDSFAKVNKNEEKKKN